ncbi:hypothetical protein BURK_009391 [Burkholderia sp. SJ98]|nr:hypothetical protein BURK_009391 [Burkholderia sp. SJ98]
MPLGSRSSGGDDESVIVRREPAALFTNFKGVVQFRDTATGGYPGLNNVIGVGNISAHEALLFENGQNGAGSLFFFHVRSYEELDYNGIVRAESPSFS